MLGKSLPSRTFPARPSACSRGSARAGNGVSRSKNGVNAAYLQVHLENAGAGVERRQDVVGDAELGIERRRRQAARGGAGEIQRPRVEIGGHAGTVCVGQGAERPDAERTQVRDALLVRPAVADRPGGTDQRAGRVEVLPDPAQQPGRKEMHVDVGQPGHAQLPAEGRHLRIMARWPHDAHQEIEPYQWQRPSMPAAPSATCDTASPAQPQRWTSPPPALTAQPVSQPASPGARKPAMPPCPSRSGGPPARREMRSALPPGWRYRSTEIRTPAGNGKG